VAEALACGACSWLNLGRLGHLDQCLGQV